MTNTSDNVVTIPSASEKSPKRRTITLTNARPVDILESDWPVVAEGSYGSEHPSGCEDLQIDFRVRMGKHCRYLIHGKFSYWVDDEHERCITVRVGRLLGYNSENKLEEALLAVGNEMKERVHVNNGYMHRWITHALDACFAKLGPQLL